MLRKTLFRLSVAAIVFCSALHLQAQVLQLSNRSRFSVITCSPGPDLYSLFGHSAFRLQDSIQGNYYDVVYNYGTFLFDETFYVKFARGKLDYLLQSSTYEDFISAYEYEGRGVWEQELRLTLAEKQRLFELLQTNLKRENCTYRYDFFYDNCSTRIRDMLMRALSDTDTKPWGYRYVAFDSLQRHSPIEFPYSRPAEQTYRKAIQTYLDYQPWSDLGIDLALGQPCDAKVGDCGLMFLPDSLMTELEFATVDGELLCERPRQLLPVNFELSVNPWSGPTTLFALFLLLHALLHVRSRKSNTFLFTDKLLFVLLGLLGCLIVFLWFFTDHTATRLNWNILWAHPLFFVFLFAGKLPRKLLERLVMTCLGFTVGAIVCAPLLPQSFHPSVFLLMLAQCLTFGKWLFHIKRQNLSLAS
jgi:hypothetical protein